MFYARYRWGNLSIEISKEPTQDVMEAMEEELFNQQIGHGFDGSMTTDTLIGCMKQCGFEFQE